MISPFSISSSQLFSMSFIIWQSRTIKALKVRDLCNIRHYRQVFHPSQTFVSLQWRFNCLLDSFPWRNLYVSVCMVFIYRHYLMTLKIDSYFNLVQLQFWFHFPGCLTERTIDSIIMDQDSVSLLKLNDNSPFVFCTCYMYFIL